MITVWRDSPEAATAGKAEFTLAPHVSLVIAEDNTARLLDMGGAFFALPAIGAEMLTIVLDRGVEAAVRELADRYEVAAARVRADLHILLRQMFRRKILERGRRREPGPGLARILAPCFSIIRSRSSGRSRTLLVLTLVKLSLLAFGWARTTTVLRSQLGKLSPAGVEPDEAKARAIDREVREISANHALPMACKERALACWTLLRWDGFEADLIVGLEFFPLIGHCWCEVGSWILSDYSDHCEFYTPVLRYD